MDLDIKQMMTMVDVISEEKGLPKETVLDVIQQAIAAAWRKDNGTKDMDVRCELNTNDGTAEVFIQREVVEDDVEVNPDKEINLKNAGKNKKVGDIVEEKHKVEGFGRVASQTAKQVIVQRLREAERDAVLTLFEDRIGEVVTGSITRVEPKLVRIDVNKVTGIMPKSEQIDRDDRGAQLILSRGCAEFIEYLFKQEVPEIESGSVEIKAVAREAGRRTKIAVASLVPGVDPVGTFVGGRGVRVQAVMNEIGDREKIDIVNWSDNPSEYIREALSPAEIQKVEINNNEAKVFVTEDQQSIAIGRQGQNVRLASKLTGFDIDIEIAKAPEKKKKRNVEDSLLSAIEEAEE